MAYSDNWNESSPAGSASAATIDTIIQNEVKRATRERAAQAIAGWADDAQDPKRIKVHVDDEYPSSLTPEEGEFFYNTAEDSLLLYYSGNWLNVGAVTIIDILSNRPAADTVRAGTLFWDIEGERLYVESDGEWISVIPEEEFLVYSETQTFSVLTLTEQSYSLGVSISETEADPDLTLLVSARGRFKPASGTFGAWVHDSVDGTSVGNDIEFVAKHVFSNYTPSSPTYNWLVTFTIENVNGSTQSITGEIELVLRRISEGIIAAS